MKRANLKTEEIMTVSALARYLRCNRHTLYRLLKKKQIPGFKLGKIGAFHALSSMSGLPERPTRASAAAVNRNSVKRRAPRGQRWLMKIPTCEQRCFICGRRLSWIRRRLGLQLCWRRKCWWEYDQRQS
jgi:excisionase family DNA binding protein